MKRWWSNLRQHSSIFIGWHENTIRSTIDHCGRGARAEKAHPFSFIQNMTILSHVSRCPDRHSNRAPPAYKPEAFLLQPTYWLLMCWCATCAWAGHSGRAVWGMNCPRSLEHWNRGFEPHSRHGCLCAFILCLCCSVCSSGLATEWPLSEESFQLCVGLRN
jgi:hypothetical protein